MRCLGSGRRAVESFFFFFSPLECDPLVPSSSLLLVVWVGCFVFFRSFLRPSLPSFFSSFFLCDSLLQEMDPEERHWCCGLLCPQENVSGHSFRRPGGPDHISALAGCVLLHKHVYKCFQKERGGREGPSERDRGTHMHTRTRTRTHNTRMHSSLSSHAWRDLFLTACGTSRVRLTSSFSGLDGGKGISCPRCCCRASLMCWSRQTPKRNCASQ